MLMGLKMIIDFHTHIFPEKIAEKALKALSDSSRTVPYTNGTYSARTESMKKAGIDYSVNLAVATKANQVEGINNVAIESREKEFEKGIINFGAMHVEYTNVKNELKRISDAGIKGIKIHPAFYQLDIKENRIKNIIYEASALGLIIITHAGWDIGFPEANYIPVDSLLEISREINPDKMVLAHMGGWNDWDKVEEYLAGSNYYFDTAFSIGKIQARKDLADPMRTYNMQEDDFVRLCKKHGVEKILFGTDTPWADQLEYVNYIKNFNFTDEEKEMIFEKNAKALLNL